MKATYVSVQEDGKENRVSCDYDALTRTVFNIQSQPTSHIIEREYVELSNGMIIDTFFEDGRLIADGVPQDEAASPSIEVITGKSVEQHCLEIANNAEAILARIREIHAPRGIFDQCDHEHTIDDVDNETVFDIDEIGLTCKKMYDVCCSCCGTKWFPQDETCVTEHNHGQRIPICPTIAAFEA